MSNFVPEMNLNGCYIVKPPMCNKETLSQQNQTSLEPPIAAPVTSPKVHTGNEEGRLSTIIRTVYSLTSNMFLIDHKKDSHSASRTFETASNDDIDCRGWCYNITSFESKKKRNCLELICPLGASSLLGL